MFDLSDAIGLATWGHRHQKDQAGMPYIDHPLRVLETVQKQGASSDVQIAAVLHDLTEDQPFTCQMLINLGVPEPAVEIVKLVDRDYSRGSLGNLWVDRLSNDDYNLLSASNPTQLEDMKRLHDAVADDYYYTNIKNNPGALQVKLADIADNTQEYRLSYLSEARQERLRAKYSKALEILRG